MAVIGEVAALAVGRHHILVEIQEGLVGRIIAAGGGDLGLDVFPALYRRRGFGDGIAGHLPGRGHAPEHHRLGAGILQAVRKTRGDIYQVAPGGDRGRLAVNRHFHLAAIDPKKSAVVGIEHRLGLFARRQADIAAVIVAGQQDLLFPAGLTGMGLEDVGDVGDGFVVAVIRRFRRLLRRPDDALGPLLAAGLGEGRCGERDDAETEREFLHLGCLLLGWNRNGRLPRVRSRPVSITDWREGRS